MRSKPWIESNSTDKPVRQWIACGDQLPPDDRIVLIHTPHATIWKTWLGWYCHEDRCWCWETGDAVPNIVSHWMDFPEEPEDG